MRYLIWILATFILLVLQNGILRPLHLGPANLILVLMMIALLTDGLSTALIICLSGGLMLDFLAGTNLGLITFSLLTTLLTGFVLFELFLARDSSPMLVAVAVAGATILNAVWLLIFNRLFNWLGLADGLILQDFLTQQVLWSLLFNLIFTYPLFKYFQLIQFVHAKSIRN